MQKRINPLEVKQEPEKIEKAPKVAKETQPVVKKVEATPVAEQKKTAEVSKKSTFFIGFLDKAIVANAKAKNPGKKLAEIINEALAEKGK